MDLGLPAAFAMTSILDGSERVYEVLRSDAYYTTIASADDGRVTCVRSRGLLDYLRDGRARPCSVVSS